MICACMYAGWNGCVIANIIYDSGLLLNKHIAMIFRVIINANNYVVSLYAMFIREISSHMPRGV